MKDTIFLSRASLPAFDEYISEIKDCWETHWITTMGPKHTEFERQLRNYLSVEFAKVFCNGHSALEMLIQAMDLHGEVITTPFTFASTTHAIVRNGLRPRFCDINENDYTIDVDKIEGLINEKTSAILAVHVFGNVCDVNKINDIALKHGLKVIYDAAHAFGEKISGTSVSAFGDASMYSFHASKVFNTIEGGAAVFHDQYLANRLDRIRMFGIGEDENIESIGANGKMNEFQAAMGICNLRHFGEEVKKRKRAYTYYRERLQGIRGIKLNRIPLNVEYNYSYFPILIDEREFAKSRDELCEVLYKNNILARKMFSQLANEYPCYPAEYNQDITPLAHYVSKHILVLPLFADITTDEIDRVCDIIVNQTVKC